MSRQFLVASFLLLLALAARGATNNLTSCDLATVSAAVAAAANGDTILLPPGRVQWDGVLSITKDLNIIGAGDNQTFITNGLTAGAYLINVQLTGSAKRFRVSGIFFEETALNVLGNDCHAFYIATKPWSGGNYIDGFRIDHCTFSRDQLRGTATDTVTIWARGRVFGVVDHCNFIDCAYGARLHGSYYMTSSYGSDVGALADWKYMPEPLYYLGSTNNFVMENCYFSSYDPTYAVKDFRFCIASDYATHYVFRNNVVSNTIPGALMQLLDAHANKICTPDADGSLSIICGEIYNNVFAGSATYQIANLRGGTWMCFSNRSYYANPTFQIEEEEWDNLGYAQSCGTGTYWPAGNMVTNSHFWANSYNNSVRSDGALTAVSVCGCYDLSAFRSIANYPPPAAYNYATRAPLPGEPMYAYRPLVYPHPLVSGGSASSGAPVILTQPASQSAIVGNSVQFGVSASGSGLGYQWQFNGGNIAAATSSTYRIASVQLTNAGQYSVVVSNNYGSTASSSAQLTVTRGEPVISTQPASIVASRGQTVNFAVQASGIAPLSYQWRFQNQNVAGATTATYAIANVGYTAQGSYNVVVSNPSGSTTSSVATLTVVADLVAAYGFEEGSGSVVNDQSSYANSGSVSNASWSGSGKFGGGMNFSSGLVIVPPTSSLNISNAITIEAWINPASNQSWENILVKGNPANSIGYVLNAAEPPSLGPSFYSPSQAGSVAATAPLPVNAWTHVCVTGDGTTITLYTNGVVVATAAQSGPLAIAADGLFLGGNPYSGHFFTGVLDEVRIYSRALSPAEIGQDMITPIAPVLGRPNPPNPPGPPWVMGVDL